MTKGWFWDDVNKRFYRWHELKLLMQERKLKGYNKNFGILAIFFMAKPTMKALKDYEDQKASGVTDYTFNPKALGIKGAEFWEKRYDEQQAKKADTK